jgi:hypothetical protein
MTAAVRSGVSGLVKPEVGSSSSQPSLLRLTLPSIPLWAGLIFLLVGVVFSVTGLQEARQEQQYREQGLTVDATVVNKSLVPAKRGEQSRTQYLLVYRFTADQGESREGTTEASVEEWEQTEVGQRISVRYLPGAAGSSRGAQQNEWATALVFSGLGLVLTLVGGWMTLSNVRLILRTIRVSRHGLPTEGVISKVGQTRTRINRVTQWQIHYRYQDHLGRNHEGRSHLLSPAEAADWRQGSTGTVRFDRQQPDVSVWLGKTP